MHASSTDIASSVKDNIVIIIIAMIASFLSIALRWTSAWYCYTVGDMRFLAHSSGFSDVHIWCKATR